MTRSGVQSGLLEAIAQFQAEMQRLAYAAVRAVIEQELARRRAQPERARPAERKRKREPPRARQLELGFTQPPERQLELPLASPAVTRAHP